MSRREDIDNAIWSDPDFLVLSPEAKLAYIWSWTNPRCGMAGIYKVAAIQAQVEIGFDQATLEKAFAELAEKRFAFFQDGLVFVRTRVRHLRQKTTQIATSIGNDLAKIPDSHPLKAQWMLENGSARWLQNVTVTRPSADRGGEGQAVSSLELNVGGSVEGRETLKGNGNGSGKGNGPQGRGLGRGEAEQFAADLGVERRYGRHYFEQLRSRGVKPTADALRPLIEQHQPLEAA